MLYFFKAILIALFIPQGDLSLALLPVVLNHNDILDMYIIFVIDCDSVTKGALPTIL